MITNNYSPTHEENKAIVDLVMAVPQGNKLLKEIKPCEKRSKMAENIRKAAWDFASELTTLDLYHTEIQHRLQPVLKKLTSLKQLNLGYTTQKNISPVVWELTNLTQLTLENHTLTELPSDIGRLTNLQLLSVSLNHLSKIPSEIGNLGSLLVLGLNNNEIEEIPPTIGHLSSLKSLNISNNRIRRLPGEIADLTSLTEINFISNQFKQFPMELGDPKKMLDLHYMFFKETSYGKNLGIINLIMATALEKLPSNCVDLLGEVLDGFVSQQTETHEDEIRIHLRKMAEQIDLSKVRTMGDIFSHFANQAAINLKSLKSGKRTPERLREKVLLSKIHKEFSSKKTEYENSRKKPGAKKTRRKRRRRKKITQPTITHTPPADKEPQTALDDIKTAPVIHPKKKTWEKQIKAKGKKAVKNPTVLAVAAAAETFLPRRNLQTSDPKCLKAFNWLQALYECKKNIKYKDLEKIAYQLGADISRKRGRGSHILALFPDGTAVTIPRRNPVAKGTAISIIKTMKNQAQKKLEN